MSEGATYSLSRLMEITEISITSVFQDQKSRAAFFEYIDGLLMLCDEVIGGYSATLVYQRDNRPYIATLGALRNRFVELNATKAVQAIQQYMKAIMAREREQARKCYLEVSDILSPICIKIRKAQIELPYEPAAEDSPQSPPAGSEPQPVAVRAEPFRQVLALIEGFEISRAMEQLAVLESQAFPEKISQTLLDVRRDLEQFDYDDAAGKLEELACSLNAAAPGADAGTGRKKVLVIDDMPVVLGAIKAMLEDVYTVCCVADHMSALKYLSSNTADLILLDIEMPDMDGFTLLGIIRKMGRYQDTPVIFLTGNTSPDHVKKAIAQGGNDFIKKPVDKKTLLARLAKQCG